MVRTLLEARAAHSTQLRVRGPSPFPHAPLAQTHPGAHRVSYTSAKRELAALYHPPTGPSRPPPSPALLYLHGGWALADEDLRLCAPFVRAGFAVLAPSYRGENGNPGPHEMLWGELDDAHAALAALSARPEVDASRVFVFGHSAGGMLAVLMSFAPESSVRLSGSVAGIYGPEMFDYQTLPFVDSARERELRLALPHIEELEQPHIAFVGDRDPAARPSAEAGARARAAGVPLEVVEVEGDHASSVPLALRTFLACVQRVL